MKKISGWLHLWLGLLSGTVVFIVAVTGCIFVFEEDLFNLIHHRLVYVAPASTAPVPLLQLYHIAQKKLGTKKKIGQVEIYPEANRSYVFTAAQNNKEKGWTYFQGIDYREELYINPYTGQITGVVDKKYEFFNVVRRIHQQLLLRNEIGSMIVGSCCLMFLALLITGFILWFPKNKATWKQRFTIKWKARWRRVNYDAHNVGGLYVLPVAMLLVVTGLVWSFDWWENSIYKLLGDRSKPGLKVEQPIAKEDTRVLTDPIDVALKESVERTPVYEKLILSFPEKKTQPLRVSVIMGAHSGWQASNTYYYHSQTGEAFYQFLQQDKTLGMKWRNSNYGIHTGSIYGWPTKIMAALASLICASLPVTGFYIWWGRRKKDAPPRQMKSKTKSPHLKDQLNVAPKKSGSEKKEQVKPATLLKARQQKPANTPIIPSKKTNQ